jgi:hypothetical protein
MKKSSRRTRPVEGKEKPAITVGMDLGDGSARTQPCDVGD